MSEDEATYQISQTRQSGRNIKRSETKVKVSFEAISFTQMGCYMENESHNLISVLNLIIYCGSLLKVKRYSC